MARHLTPEARARMGKPWLGKQLSPEHRARIAAGNRGKRLSAEHRAKISAAAKQQTRRGAAVPLDVPPAEAEAMVAAYVAGAGLEPVGARFGYSTGVVRRLVVAAGIAIRPARRPRKVAGGGTTPHRPGTTFGNQSLHAPNMEDRAQ